jgi:hypothetical protein
VLLEQLFGTSTVTILAGATLDVVNSTSGECSCAAI